MIKQNTYFKDDGGLCIDLLITNSNFSFVRTNSLKTGLSDHHIINAILKTKLEKFEPKKSIYRNFKQYDSDQLKICNSMFPMRTHAAFEKKFNSILGKRAAKKTKILRGNQNPYFNKNLQKQIMIRSRQRNKANK